MYCYLILIPKISRIDFPSVSIRGTRENGEGKRLWHSCQFTGIWSSGKTKRMIKSGHICSIIL